MTRLTALLLLAASLHALASTVLYRETFADASLKPTARGLREIIATSADAPVRHALRLVTTRGGNQHTPSWTSHAFGDLLRQANADITIVDYWLNPVTPSARYMLFVRDARGRQLAAVLLRNGKVSPNSNGRWLDGPALAHNTWHHVRYTISSLSRTYSIFLDDMTQPAIADIQFRHHDAETPASLWIEGSETEPSETLLGDITVSAPERRGFPRPALTLPPFNALSLPLKPVDDAPTPDDWRTAPAITLLPAHQEQTTVRLLLTRGTLHAQFTCLASDMPRRSQGETTPDGKVWRDDCAELMLMTDPASNRYLHFAVNALGTRYDAACTIGSKQRDAAFDSGWTATVERGDHAWTATFCIPLRNLGVTPAHGQVWKLLVGRENNPAHHVAAWPPTQSFHNHNAFALAAILEHEPDQPEAAQLEETLFRMRFLPQRRLDDTATRLRQLPHLAPNPFRKRLDDCHAQFDHLARVLGDAAEPFATRLAALDRLAQLNQTIATLEADIIRFSALFAPGKPGHRDGCVLLTEAPTVKVAPDTYCGNVQPVRSLALAQGETGSIQAVVIIPGHLPPADVTLAIEPLDDLARQLMPAVSAFEVRDVRTCLQNAPVQHDVPDVLVPLPGAAHTFADSHLSRLWLDLAAPRGLAGQAAFRLTARVRREGQPTLDLTLPLHVTIRPFALPEEFSLSTAFCFTPAWASAFYGKTMPQDKRLRYFDFILDHHLDPQNLWCGNRAFLSEDEIRHCLKRGMKNIYLPIIDAAKNRDNMTRNLEAIDHNGWRKRVIAFGFDEILCYPDKIPQMQQAFRQTKEAFPDIPRLNTSHIDERLFGYVDIWCPLFDHFSAKDADARLKLGEQVWWYPTDYPSAPYANFNLDSPGIDPRIIPWMTRRLNISGLLYWGLNREWQTNAEEHLRLKEQEKATYGLQWMTDDCRERMRQGARWPDVPWVPFFRSVLNRNAAPSATNGGGNLMYPGPDWTPWPSTRLKNLRDVLQDLEYRTVLRQRLDAYAQRPDASPDLIHQATEALAIPDAIVASPTAYTKELAPILAQKERWASLIARLQQALQAR
ncbi:MAG: glycoside hydrolase domain-containing protein [Oligosphaeraceae bacterium]